MRNIAIIALLGLGGWYYFSRYQLAKKIKIVFRKVSISGSVLRPKFNLTFGVQNPTGQKTVVKSIVGTVLANGKSIADVSQFSNTTIFANSETPLTITVEPVVTSVLSEIVNFITGKEKKVVVSFVGNINAENITIPVNEKIKI